LLQSVSLIGASPGGYGKWNAVFRAVIIEPGNRPEPIFGLLVPGIKECFRLRWRNPHGHLRHKTSSSCDTPIKIRTERSIRESFSTFLLSIPSLRLFFIFAI